MIAVLCGGVGAARFLLGLRDVVDETEITAIVNTGDDLEWNTLRVCPDLDTVTYTLSGKNAATGWGLEGETWNALAGLERFGSERWFGIGDTDLATHLFRSESLAAGVPLHEVTSRIARSFGIALNIVPMSNDRVRTRLTTVDGEEIDFQEYFVHRRHSVAVRSIRFAGAESAAPAPGVVEVLERADAIIIAPSNPLVSIGPIVAIEPIAEVLERRRQDVAAISPIVGGRALKGPADRLLVELGHASSASGVAAVLSRFVATMIIDEQDRDETDAITDLGMQCVLTNTVMDDRVVACDLARTVLGALGVVDRSIKSPDR